MDDNAPDTEAIARVTARVTILGMLDTARTSAYDMYGNEDDED